MSLRIDENQLKNHFLGLGYSAEIDRNAPEAPWENTAVVLKHREYSGITLIISVGKYLHELVEIERRWEANGRTNILGDQSSAGAEAPSSCQAIPKMPVRRAREVTDATNLSTLDELDDLVQVLISARGTIPRKRAPLSAIDLLPEVIDINREINRGGRNSKGSTQQAQKPLRKNF
jgi:hypothetical protein